MISEDKIYFEIRKNPENTQPKITEVINTENQNEPVSEKEAEPAEKTYEHKIEFSSCSAENLYNIICSALAEYRSDIHLEEKTDKNDVIEAVEIISVENPEYFWISGYSLTIADTYSDISLNSVFDTDGRELSEMFLELQNAADEIIGNIPENSSDYEKALFVHDSIINSSVYDLEGRDTNTSGIWSTAYGCLVENKAVCQGYAEAFKLIMDKLEIESGIVSGKGKDEDHAWNYIKLGGEYYWVDLTWDDPLNSNGIQILDHKYCFLDDRFLINHTPDSSNRFIPQCNSMKYNYYSYNGTYAESYDFEDINRIISSVEENDYAEIMFSSSEAVDECVNDLFKNNMIWKTDRLKESDADDEVLYIYDSDINTLRVMFNG